MPEAEDVITDVARHATDYARALWLRHRAVEGPHYLRLAEAAPRLDLLLSAVFGRRFRLRVAQPPAPPTLLGKLFHRRHGPQPTQALPATDGENLWLPGQATTTDTAQALQHYRALALQQGMRAVRGSCNALATLTTPLERDLYLLLEAQTADHALAALLPGLAPALTALRRVALAARPPLARFPPARQPLEQRLRELLGSDCREPSPTLPLTDTPQASVQAARELAPALAPADTRATQLLLLRDVWTGELRAPAAALPASAAATPATNDTATEKTPRSAHLDRRPQVRDAPADEDDEQPGAWMIQTSQPHEKAEDPIGLQRPTDRDEDSAAEDYAESLAELPEARLVRTPGRPREVLLSDDPPEALARRSEERATVAAARFTYPEWDCRAGGYRDPGATVHLLPTVEGDPAWVTRTLDKHRGLLLAIRRRFEMLRARRVRLRKQPEGDDIDLDAYIESHADFRAGLPLAQALYQTCRPARRDLALLLLIDVSGSTDGWVAQDLRVIDVEREALLLVSIALDGLGEPYAIQAFSGEGPGGVTVRPLKRFDERHSDAVARRIATLEPEHYTRAGAALRHASAELMRQGAAHRLLLLLSDGKPNDIDDYEGRYGVEDMRQAVTEARLQGISCFCLTIDRQAANYLPAVFGAHQYALLQEPSRLPLVLLDWLKRLVTA